MLLRSEDETAIYEARLGRTADAGHVETEKMGQQKNELSPI